MEPNKEFISSFIEELQNLVKEARKQKDDDIDVNRLFNLP